jgi:pantoate--beta-alanine ligase
MSSRNVYLSPAERKAAVCLSRGLARARELWEGGERDAQKLRQGIAGIIEAEPLARIEYVALADAESMAEVPAGRAVGPVMAALAVRIGKTRLIDNAILGQSA